jgi:ParB/RepB/Spo0J family partition protein
MVRPLRNKSKFKFQTVFGQGRLDDAKKAGVRKIPAIIRDCTEDEAVRLNVIENLHRDNLTPLEEGRAFAELRNRGYSLAEMRKLVRGKHSRGTISDRIMLWENTDAGTKKAIAKHAVSVSTVEFVLREYRDKETGKVDMEFATKALETIARYKMNLEEAVIHTRAIRPSIELRKKIRVVATAFGQPTVPPVKPEPKPQYWVLQKSTLGGNILSADKNNGAIVIETPEGLKVEMHFSPANHKDVAILLKKVHEGLEQNKKDLLRVGLWLETEAKKKRAQQPAVTAV